MLEGTEEEWNPITLRRKNKNATIDFHLKICFSGGLFILAKVEAGEDPSATLGNREESEENDMAEMLEDLFASVMTVMDTTDPERPLHLMFRLLPSQKRYILRIKSLLN